MDIIVCVKTNPDLQMVRLKNQWMPMDPREWVNKFDITVTVGLGTGSKEAQLAGVQQVLQLQMTALQAGTPIVTPTNIYHSAVELVKAANLKGEDLFFTDPSQMPQQPQSDPAQAQMAAEMEKAKMQAMTQLEIAKMKAGVDMQKIQAQTKADLVAERMKLAAEQQSDKITQMMDYQKHRDEMILQDRVSGREQATQQTIAVDTNGIKEAVSAISEGMQQQSQVFGQIAELIAAATQSMGP